MENITHAIESLTVWDCVYYVVAMGMLFVLNSKIEVKGPEGIGKGARFHDGSFHPDHCYFRWVSFRSRHRSRRNGSVEFCRDTLLT